MRTLSSASQLAADMLVVFPYFLNILADFYRRFYVVLVYHFQQACVLSLTYLCSLRFMDECSFVREHLKLSDNPCKTDIRSLYNYTIDSYISHVRVPWNVVQIEGILNICTSHRTNDHQFCCI